MTNRKELKSKREDRRVKRQGFRRKSRFKRRQEGMKARYKGQLVGRNEEIKDVGSEDRQTDGQAKCLFSVSMQTHCDSSVLSD